jgi:hypothetical protein
MTESKPMDISSDEFGGFTPSVNALAEGIMAADGGELDRDLVTVEALSKVVDEAFRTEMCLTTLVRALSQSGCNVTFSALSAKVTLDDVVLAEYTVPVPAALAEQAAA